MASPYTPNQVNENQINPSYLVSSQNLVCGQPTYPNPQYYPSYPNQPIPPPEANPPPQIVVMNAGTVAGGNIQPAVVFPFCRFCNKNTQTTVKYKVGGLVIILAVVLCFFTGCLCFIPFLVDSWKDKEHICVNCANVKGTVKGELC